MRVHPKEVKVVKIDEKTKEVKAEVVDDVRPKCFRVHPKEEVKAVKVDEKSWMMVHPKEEVKAVEIDEKTKEVKAEVVDEGPPKGGGESCQNRREDQRSRG
ncbi:uncharacterized protein LOC144078039 isoform X4 [Stigmatopora argus]